MLGYVSYTLLLRANALRRNSADLIEVFKIIKSFSAVSAENLFDINKESRTRGHSLKLVKHSCKTDLRNFFFSERVINRWNSLDQWCVDATSTNGFKAELTRWKRNVTGALIDDFWSSRSLEFDWTSPSREIEERRSGSTDPGRKYWYEKLG